MSDRARITDVSPRDGLQNEPGIVPTEQKARLIGLLAAAGVDEIEITSFVSPKAVPQLGDALQLCEMLAEFKPSGVVFSSLVPNEQGMAAALTANELAGLPLIDKVAVFTAASETFASKNINASIDEATEMFRPVVRSAFAAGLRIRGYISCAFACPFEGPIAPEKVGEVALALAELGIEEIDLGDTIGDARPEQIKPLIDAVLKQIGDDRLDSITLHLHDTHGRAAECLDAAIQLGIRSFDGAVSGLGGCPFASTDDKRAPGNVATSFLLDAAERAGIEHRVNRERLAEAAAFAAQITAEAREQAHR